MKLDDYSKTLTPWIIGFPTNESCYICSMDGSPPWTPGGCCNRGKAKGMEDCPNIEDHHTDLRRRLIHQDHDQLYRWEEGVR